jgi:hypothetical protein
MLLNDSNSVSSLEAVLPATFGTPGMLSTDHQQCDGTPNDEQL